MLFKSFSKPARPGLRQDYFVMAYYGQDPLAFSYRQGLRLSLF